MIDAENKSRFQVVEGSASGHCCFVASVIDTSIIVGPGEGSFGDDWICECYDRDTAEVISNALNASHPEVDISPTPCLHS